MRTRPVGQTAGASLVEVVLALSMLVLMMGWMALVSRTSERAYRHGSAVGDVELRSGLALAAVVRELELAIAESVFVDPAAPSEIRYRRLLDVVGSDVVISEPRLLRFEREPGEIDNGADDDGDGLVDEGIVVLILNPGEPDERRRVIASGVAALLEGEAANGLDDNGNGLVDEPGFIVVRRGARLDVHSTFVRGAQGDAVGVARTFATSVLMRN